MRDYDETLAANAIETLPFSAANARLARYWLSLWQNGVPPVRRALNPAKVKDLLPGMAIIEFHADGRAICRLAGSAIAMAVGIDPTGQDILALTPEQFRGQRLARYRTVSAGAVSRCVRSVENRFGAAIQIEDIQLPLSDEIEGAALILYHAAWRAETLDRTQPEILRGFGVAADEAISFVRTQPQKIAV